MSPLREFPINVKPARSEAIDSLCGKYRVSPERLRFLTRAAALLALAPRGLGSRKRMPSFHFNPRYMEYALESTRDVWKPEAQADVLHRLAQEKVSRQILAQELSSFYAKVAMACTWLEIEGHGRVPYLHCRNLSLLGLVRNFNIPDFNRDASDFLRGTHESKGFMPVLPNEKLGNNEGVAQQSLWLLPGGEENTEAVLRKLSSEARLFISAAQIVADPITFESPST